MSKSLAIVGALLIAPAAIAQNDAPSPGGRMPSPEQIVGFLDADKDGLVARDEAKGPLAANFDYVDTDKDGKVSLAELKTAMEAMRPPEPPMDEPEEPAPAQ